MHRYPIGPATLEMIQGDIVTQDTDAIVNAANEELLRGGGVCGAIFRAAGAEQITAAFDAIGHCPTGEARWMRRPAWPSVRCASSSGARRATMPMCVRR